MPDKRVVTDGESYAAFGEGYVQIVDGYPLRPLSEEQAAFAKLWLGKGWKIRDWKPETKN